ncbi:hypothetical protein [Actinokineospora sp. UTMC 2448]|uniref:hypothetical protein n=1 Tax=Actinokineospora sp. UTMC 2448 TaxID=2268449 RepID=UPI0021641F99|nr:hypothetical protein [Actinokineospora sp. UTMC 2448]UVS77371.1 hypothetical protein Actkin_01081 [Actinokineospora sp. UTMC 2448]
MDPILVDVAAALAARSATSLYDTVKAWFTRGGRQADVLEAAEGAAPDSPEVAALAEELARAEADDPEFADTLRAEWEAARDDPAAGGGVSNRITGTVTGNVLQMKDNNGTISFGS